MSNKPTKRNIKESFDNLPVGLSYFNSKGIPILCNRRMHELIYEMTGCDLQLISDLEDALGMIEKDGEIWLFPSGSAWQFKKNTVHADEDYIEYIAVDVTELHKRKKELELSTEEYRKMVANMKQIVDNVVAITREEEILSLKMSVHSKVGSCLHQLRRFLDGDNLYGKDEIVLMLQDTISSLKGEVAQVDETDSVSELIRVAESLGVILVRSGELPESKLALDTIIMAVRECITNTIRHAKGDKVYVDFQYIDSGVTALITNNGIQPQSAIVEGGGLSSLRRSIEKAGGAMSISSEPRFELSVYMPL